LFQKVRERKRSIEDEKKEKYRGYVHQGESETVSLEDDKKLSPDVSFASEVLDNDKLHFSQD